MNIGIDIDDTISKTFEYSYPLAKEYTKKYFNKESLDIEDISAPTHGYLKVINNWDKQEEVEFWDKNYLNVIQNVEPKEDVIEVLKKLKSEGHSICLITARIKVDSFDVIKETQKWLNENEIVYDELIIDALEKGEIAKKQNIDIFIDDSFKNCKDMVNFGIEAYLIESPVNKGLQDEKITRVISWNEIYEKINKKAKNN